MNHRKLVKSGILAIVLSFALLFSGCTDGSDSPTTSTGINADGTNGTVLFGPSGSFASRVARTNLAKGAVFSFFGYDWRVVAVKDNIATFWMDAPYTTSPFTTVITFGDVQDENNTWNNGYYSATWDNKELGTSAVRMLLTNAVSTIIGTKAGSDKVVAGAVAGINEESDTLVVNDIYYRKDRLTNVKYAGVGQSIIIDYGIGSNDKLWLPSYEEIKNNGLWSLSNIGRNWTDTANGTFAWLRTPFSGNDKYPSNNCDSMLVGYRTTVGKESDNESVFFDYADQVHGVRPAIHLDITTLE